MLQLFPADHSGGYPVFAGVFFSVTKFDAFHKVRWLRAWPFVYNCYLTLPHSVFRGFLSISGWRVLLYKAVLILAEDTPHVAMQRISTF